MVFLVFTSADTVTKKSSRGALRQDMTKMEHLRQYSPPYFDGYTWDRGGYWYCPAEWPEDQMQCLYYETEDTDFWECRFCDGDCCAWRDDR